METTPESKALAIQTLKELALECGLEITVAEKPTKRIPNHSNKGKSYRTKNTIIREIATARKTMDKLNKEKATITKTIKEGKARLIKLDKEVSDLVTLLGGLVTEATKKGATQKDIKKVVAKQP